MRRAAVFVLLAGALSGLALAQPPADKKSPPTGKDKKDTPPAATKDAPPLEKLPDTKDVAPPEPKSFKSADGVTLNGLFYKSAKGGNSPVVVLLHEYKKDPNDTRWDGTAKLLAASGFNALRFAFRGHGDLKALHSKDIDAGDFFGGPYSGPNRALVSAPNPAAKATIDPRDFRTGYQPMLVQDLAAARTLLDQMNDTGECNTSSIYLVGAGDTVNLGFLFLASEWHRERERVRTFFGVVPPVTALRPLIGDVGPAGQDYAGCVWLGPTTDPSNYPVEKIKLWVNDVSGLKLRNETPMLFLYGGADPKGKAGATAYYDTVLKAGVKAAAGGAALPGIGHLTYKEEVGKGVKNLGATLLGNNLGTEQRILAYLAAMEKERKNKPRKNRDFEKPLYIDVRSFGVMAQGG
jgi:pimeloyl-ACP methyl ester carboxylesterase